MLEESHGSTDFWLPSTYTRFITAKPVNDEFLHKKQVSESLISDYQDTHCLN